MATINRPVLDEHMKKLSKWFLECPVKEYRETEHLTQFQLSQIFNVTTTAVQNWERGVHPSNNYVQIFRTIIEDYDEKMTAWLNKKPLLKNVRTP
jgi:DNA-binding transcriptional regulator YiaG